MEKELLLRFLRRYRPLALAIIGASVLLNLLVFAGSIYMLLVYDSVLPSRSIETLLGLFVILAVLYAFQAIFEAIRSEALLAMARRLHEDLAPRIHQATMMRPLRIGGDGDGLQMVRDLDQLYSFLSSPGPVALIDLPWVILFLTVLFLLHWWLGVAALFGVIVLAAIAWSASARTASGSRDLVRVIGDRQTHIQAEFRFSETASALGMRARLLTQSSHFDRSYLDIQSALSRIVARFGGSGRAFRLLIQSLILTVGALLVIDGKASGGIIIASSVLSGRALAPVDQAIANWRGLVAARNGWHRIVLALEAFPLQPKREVTLDRPSQNISLRDVWVAPPGGASPVVVAVSMDLSAGDAVAIIGPSAAGKTSLAKALLGIWPLARGEIRLDGATHEQWDADALGASFGYVAQNVELVAGTIGENIARFDPDASSLAIISAAKGAGMHETILAFPNGYETRVSNGGSELSAGQRQRIGLARALYGEPFMLLLDEANSNLDADGDEALANAVVAVKARGGIVVMITHRPATLGPISHVAVLNSGKLTDFGDRDEVLTRLSRSKPAGPKAA